MPLTVSKELEMNDLYNVLWSGARDKWFAATEEQHERVWNLLIDVFQYNESEIPSVATINDFIWFECDDIFDEPE